MRPEAISAKFGFQAITLRPSLRAAATLESRYGFQKLFDAVGDGNLTVIADVIEASSDCKDFLKAIAGIPLIQVLPNVLEKTTKHILALAGADEDHAEKAQPQNGESMPFAEYHTQLYRIGTGWLGWSPETTWNATPREITEAYGAHIEQLKAIYGANDQDQDQRTGPDNATLDRIGLARLKAMTGMH